MFRTTYLVLRNCNDRIIGRSFVFSLLSELVAALIAKRDVAVGSKSSVKFECCASVELQGKKKKEKALNKVGKRCKRC